ncbi:fumarylacetoacetate hydrolase family protein [Rhodococcus opacus]|uniref:fumarylacetoacetate hydrolase family protein n=1 Tax=Rhodococcus opacus TaxID=37919 RepID=UPI001C4563D2|nr:fumarylacetoacetate hydrolase family protein [Rhodococcus opacus]MBV6760225.1 fumarylacetoacetate hydrolase family protein [Rhodococcus opacus]
MRLGTIRTADGTRAFRQIGERTELLAATDVGALLRNPFLLQDPGEPIAAPAAHLLAPPVLAPTKFLCAGLNYFEHAREVGKPAPQYPTLFAKLPNSIVGAAENIELPVPSVSERVDWEAELVIVIGTRTRDVDEAGAARAIFGYTAMNDISVRDWQKRTEEWLQGKNFDRTTPVGPVVVTVDEFDPADPHLVETLVGTESKQAGRTSDLIFSPAALVAYIAQFMTLEPGDLIATGTPAGVGSGRTPQEFLKDGDVVTTRIDGIGTLRNLCVIPAALTTRS